jgi:dolichol-phosphate mannosyltransferase/undecaprenyl-phosphate 4-deoxy-4-formamido-L-arabinose transferase
MQLISIVIPVYRSSESLKIIADEIFSLFSKLEFNYELIFVNDSPDNFVTNEVLNEIKEKYTDNISILEMKKNFGQQFAVLCGLEIAKGDYIITMDDDLQHPVEEIPRMIDMMINSNLDVILAVPKFHKRKHSLYKTIGKLILNKFERFALDVPKNLVKSSFRIIKKDIVESVVRNFNASPAITALILQETKKIANITVEHRARKFGKSNYSFSKMVSLALNNFLHYSSFPLKMLGIIGIIVFIFSIFFILITFARKIFFGMDYPGYASIVILTSFFGGLNLLGIGIIGEYLLRILKEIRKPNLKDLYNE